MIIVGIHLGLHWIRVLVLSRSILGLSANNTIGTAVLRVVAGLLAELGIWSYSMLGVWTKLTFTYSLDVWNFKTSVTLFFGHWASVVALPAIVTHYFMLWWRIVCAPFPIVSGWVRLRMETLPRTRHGP